MAKTAVIVAFEVKAGQVGPFLGIIKIHAARTLAEEPGCERFDVLIPTDGTAAVHLHEVYADDDAFAEHRQSLRLADVRDGYQDLIVDRTLSICSFVS